jgi:hypothetical protein
MSNKQEVLDKILELHKDTIQEQVKDMFLDYLVFGTTRFEMHADGVKEVPDECPFCPPDDKCNKPWCPYTKEE